jgi:hypothetical protein
MDADEMDGVLPTPNDKTSESILPNNESLNPDDTDYGDSETPEVDEEMKSED